MSLASGNYLTKVERRVVVWPAPDMNGDGPEVWITQFDNEGRQVGRALEKDKHGNTVRSYSAPEGFQNRPGYDHTDNYVLCDDRGQIVRQPNGEAIGIQPGQALVFEPDGSISRLKDEYEQYVFGLAHDSSDAAKPVDDVPPDFTDNGDVAVEDPRDVLIRDLQAQLEGKSLL